jgi:transcription antitermination factor NusG
VLGWVRFDGVASSIADDIVDELARRVESINDNGGLWIRYKPGQKVRVVSGQFESLAQVAEEPTSSDSKVRVLLEFMGQLVSAEVPWSDLHIAPEDSRGDANHGGRRRTRGRGRWIRNRGSEAIALI